MKRNTIKLKTDTKAKIVYYLSDITEEERDLIIANKNNLARINPEFDFQIQCENIIKMGETATLQPIKLAPFVSYLKGYFPSFNNKNKKVQYRDYTKSEEDQLKNAWLIRVCEDAKSSAKTAIKKMKSKYTILWTKIEN